MGHFPRPRPERVILEGRYARLEPLRPELAADLFEATVGPDAEARFRYLYDFPPKDLDEMQKWTDHAAAREDMHHSAIRDRATGLLTGRQSLMRIDADNGSVEVGNILWGYRMARTRLATEALYLHAKYCLETLGYQRFEWKCHNHNEPSKRAAIRFGFQFEGVFRKHVVQKGELRDTAWFAMIDDDWPRIRAEYDRWLDPSNFDASGIQKTKLNVSALLP